VADDVILIDDAVPPCIFGGATFSNIKRLRSVRFIRGLTHFSGEGVMQVHSRPSRRPAWPSRG